MNREYIEQEKSRREYLSENKTRSLRRRENIGSNEGSRRSYLSSSPLRYIDSRIYKIDCPMCAFPNYEFDLDCDVCGWQL